MSARRSRRQFLRSSLGVASALAAGGLPRVSSAAPRDNVVRIGYIDQFTGARANFAESAPWVISQVRALLANGLKVGGRRYEVEIIVRDSQSDSNRMGSLGNELAVRHDVDLLLVADGLAAPALEICDQNGTPAISTLLQWEPFYAARGGKPQSGYPWSFLFFWSAADIVRNYVGMWAGSGIERRVGTFFADNDFGHAFSRGLSQALAGNGFAEIRGGIFKDNVDDFSNQVMAFRDGRASILAGLVFPSQFSTFWAQAQQAGLGVEAVTLAAAFVFPSGVEVLGSRGAGMSTEVWFNRQLPFHSSLTGQSADQLCAGYEQATGRQWVQPMGYHHALWELALGALRDSGDPKNRHAVRAAIANTCLDSVIGRIDFRNSPLKSVAVTWITMGQWRRNPGGRYPYELFVTNNLSAPQVPVQREFLPLSKLQRAGA